MTHRETEPMSPRILIPVDESPTSQHTNDAIIANRALMPAEVYLLHVVDVHLIQRLVPDIQKNMIYEAAEKAGRRLLDRLAGQFREAGFEPQLLLELGTPGASILKVVEELDIQLLIIGRHPGGGGFRDIMFGSVANYVIRSIKCPVLLF
jgi:nucleotide-binding universal stress UspA family protein